MSNSTKPKITNVKIRMYCLGTGDCFILKFCAQEEVVFTMMIDCGSCRGGRKEFIPYIENISEYVGKKIDLLVVTHEHNDHVNGFAKCEDYFEKIKIDRAWFAWTENPDDPEGRASDLLKKRKRMKRALSNAITEIKNKGDELIKELEGDYYLKQFRESHKAFLNGLDVLSEINLPASGEKGQPLPGMTAIKSILKKQGTNIRYLNTGESISMGGLPGFKFHVLGPPYEKDYIFKNGKEGTDVYKKKLFLHDSSLSVNAFINLHDRQYLEKDLPFPSEYIANEQDVSLLSTITSERTTSMDEPLPVQVVYNDPAQKWRRITNDWLSSAGSLALRLNTHINNTSLVLAMEDQHTKKVLLFPGDAEYGSWESWHLIEKWNKKGTGGKHLVEDLLNRTVFYKVSHHLSYNGTALEKGIKLMESSELSAMATLDRRRISKGWKSTMPNNKLLADLIKRCSGRLFIMDEFEIRNRPSYQLDPASLGNDAFDSEFIEGTKNVMYKQYTVRL